MSNEQIKKYRNQAYQHLTNELLPFWENRCVDKDNGGYITHFDNNGNDSGEDEKSLIAQSRTVYTFSAAHRAGYGDGRYAEIAKHGVDFLIDKMWDSEHQGFYWLMNRKGEVLIDEKIVYGHSFAIYSLSEYTLATGDPRGLEYAIKVFDLLQIHGADIHYGGYFEMFHRNWELKGEGPAGGDRKTLDAHMHLMEAFTTLYEASGQQVHRRKLTEMIDLLIDKIMHPVHGTGIPQFWADWKVAPQIKFDIIWGWDRFSEDGFKSASEDNTSYGHNVEFAWLLMHALDILNIPYSQYQTQLLKSFDHAVAYGIDWEFGGVFVEGSHSGEVYDREKEFWQQAEVLIGMLDAYRVYEDPKYLKAYDATHQFVFDHMIHASVGEWLPLLSRQGQPIWNHMSHSWKVNYHSVRAMVQSIIRLDKLIARSA
ncbi:mannobiose 2-epimerase [Dyadobacter jejuensis]|uniref:Mannobiose 2-epimerase n=1 Tax=Dyadobacter jejuensis TaxID=1082580 RepID=A0A316ALI7_9BACT|nr:AGE family epimerase/isomerase [Dyadobacter jejuensis]PWJ58421.1 mannobiose 2-epimerase [Dyadobacter jejuensis]